VVKVDKQQVVKTDSSSPRPAFNTNLGAALAPPRAPQKPASSQSARNKTTRGAGSTTHQAGKSGTTRAASTKTGKAPTRATGAKALGQALTRQSATGKARSKGQTQTRTKAQTKTQTRTKARPRQRSRNPVRRLFGGRPKTRTGR
jgi:hypothetical protein